MRLLERFLSDAENRNIIIWKLFFKLDLFGLKNVFFFSFTLNQAPVLNR